MRFSFVFFVLIGLAACTAEPMHSESSPLEQEPTMTGSLEQLEEILFDAAMKAGTNQRALVSYSPGLGYFYELETYTPSPLHSRKVRCVGDGVSFARRVKDAVDKYGCQKITKRDSGGYQSEDC